MERPVPYQARSAVLGTLVLERDRPRAGLTDSLVEDHWRRLLTPDSVGHHAVRYFPNKLTEIADEDEYTRPSAPARSRASSPDAGGSYCTGINVLIDSSVVVRSSTRLQPSMIITEHHRSYSFSSSTRPRPSFGPYNVANFNIYF